MPVRVTCPACSATLSIRDEFAGRAVKCPKCAGLIPPQPAAPPTVSEAESVATVPPPPPAAPPKSKRRPEPEPEPEPQPAAKAESETAPPKEKARDRDDEDDEDRPRKKKRRDDEDDEDDRPRKKRREPEVAAKAESEAPPKEKERDEEEDDRPRKKRRDDEDDEDDRPRKKRRDEDDRDEDEGDDRPRKKRRREDDEDDDEDDRPRKKRRDDDDEDDPRPVVQRRKQAAKSNMPLILAGALVALLGICGVGGYVIYSVVGKKDEGAGSANTATTRANYDKLTTGATTRAQAEGILGKGRAPAADELAKIFGSDKSSAASWQGGTDKGRVLLWQNGDDYILVQLHPTADADARVQMKSWKPKAPPGTSDGSSDDAAFVQKYPPPATELGPATADVPAADLAAAYKLGRGPADAKYKDKVITVEGPLDAIDLMPDGVMYARLVGTGTVATGGVQPRCVVQPADAGKVWNCSRGQVIKFKGKCAGLSGPFVDVMSAKVESTGKDPALSVAASTLLSAYATNEGTADERYKDKQLTVTGAVVESVTADAVYFTSKAAKSGVRIKVAVAGDFRKLFEGLKVGDSRKLKGECGGKFQNDVSLNGAWLAP